MKLEFLVEKESPSITGINRLITFIEKKYDKAKEKNDKHGMNQACLYLAYVMAIRDLDNRASCEDEEFVPKKYLHTQPNIRSAMKLVKTFAKKTEKDRETTKRVKDHYSKFINDNGRLFKHHVAKTSKYFSRIKINENSQDLASHPWIYIGFSVAEIDFLRKLQNNRHLGDRLKESDEYDHLVKKLKDHYGVDSKKEVLDRVNREEALRM